MSEHLILVKIEKMFKFVACFAAVMGFVILTGMAII